MVAATNRLKAYPMQVPVVESSSRWEAALIGVGIGACLATVIVALGVLALAVIGAVTVVGWMV